jgi:hypothetical protein
VAASITQGKLTQKERRWVENHKSKKTAAGPSGISYATMKHLPEVAWEALIAVWDLALEGRVVPAEMARGWVCTIPKETFPPTMDTSRPITLLEHGHKFLTQILSREIGKAINSHGEFLKMIKHGVTGC